MRSATFEATWIPNTLSTLPENVFDQSDEVLVSLGNGHCDIKPDLVLAYYNFYENQWVGGNGPINAEVTHWLPLDNAFRALATIYKKGQVTVHPANEYEPDAGAAEAEVEAKQARWCSFIGCEQVGIWRHINSGSLFCEEHYRLNLIRFDEFHCDAHIPASSN